MQIAQLSNLVQVISRRLSRKEGPPDQAKLSDLSYEDALLDAQLRAFFRADRDPCSGDSKHGRYSTVEAPDGVFARVLYSIRIYSEEEERRRRAQVGFKGVSPLAAEMLRQLGQALSAICRFGSRSGVSRALSGSLVAALLVLAIAPGLAQSMNGRSIASMLGGREVSAPQPLSEAEITPLLSTSAVSPAFAPEQGTSPARRSEQARLLLELKTGEDFDAPAGTQVADEPDLNPVERGMAPNKAKRSPDEPAPLRPTGGEE